METYLYNDLYQLERLHWWHQAKQKTVRFLVQRIIQPQNTISILDIGCGTGENMRSLASFGDVSGIDNSAHAIAFCKKRDLSQVAQKDAASTGFKKDSFDVITLLDIIEHVDDNLVMKEVYRILKPGGNIIITVPAYQALWSQWDVVLHHKRRYTKKSLQHLVITSGFSVEKISYLYSFLVLPVFLIRTIKSLVGKKDYGSDFTLNTPFINFLLSFFAAVERRLLLYVTIPFGTSVVCVAKKMP